MREIKFRIWDKKYKVFRYTSDRGSILNEYALLGFHLENEDYFENEEELIIQQFTGLLDKNNKEIYEGDIIKDTWKENRPYGYSPDRWSNEEDIFVVKYDLYSFNLDKKYCKEQTCIEDFDRKVIGNINQNPELLNLTKSLTFSI